MNTDVMSAVRRNKAQRSLAIRAMLTPQAQPAAKQTTLLMQMVKERSAAGPVKPTLLGQMIAQRMNGGAK